MKKLSLKKLNLESGDLLKSEELKNILGEGGGTPHYLACSTGTFPNNPVTAEVCSNPTLMDQLCFYAGCGDATICHN